MASRAVGSSRIPSIDTYQLAHELLVNDGSVDALRERDEVGVDRADVTVEEWTPAA